VKGLLPALLALVTPLAWSLLALLSGRLSARAKGYLAVAGSLLTCGFTLWCYRVVGLYGTLTV